MKQSKIVTFIGGFYIFGGIVVLLSLLFNGGTLNHVFGIPQVPDYLVKALVAIIYIPMGYFYLKRVYFSYWFILILAVIFFFISADLTAGFTAQPYFGNMFYSLFVIVITFLRKKEFCKSLQMIRDSH